MKIRVGFGFDVHRLVEGRELWLGGIRIEHSCGLLGHSDADVLIHALCDALLGAANMRDIGFHFPDTAGEYKNIDSKILLRDTVKMIRDKGYQIGNADITVCAERPKLNPHIPAMKKCLAEVMEQQRSLDSQGEKKVFRPMPRCCCKNNLFEYHCLYTKKQPLFFRRLFFVYELSISHITVLRLSTLYRVL